MPEMPTSSSRRSVRTRSPTATSGDQPPSAKCRRLLDSQHASTATALLPNNDVQAAKGKLNNSHSINSSCQQALDKMTLLVLMFQQELVTLLAKLALEEIEPSGVDAGSFALAQSPGRSSA
ncbi:unnamed protein product [Dibothriocephalus latus]|uniref:Uncharacterized protein n=1 Tax=Dibothriocephalus latus TaxID=60516 RepID=A0A3P7PVZ7_DIBLA|nr:unnamed protein product [Dibothriocephalus latus]